MVALLSEIPAGCSPSLRPVASRARSAAPLQVVPVPARSHRPNQTRRPSRVTYIRRRVAAVGVLVLLAFLIAIAADAALARIGGGPLTTTGATSGQEMAAAQEWVVKPGDTIWSIAEAIDRRGDVRPLVDRLSEEIGNASLYPGEVIQLPASR
jgi:hypothetical protein